MSTNDERDESQSRIAALERRLLLARKFIPQDRLEEYDKADDEFCAGREDPYRAKLLVDCVTDFEKLAVSAGTEVTVVWPLPSLGDPKAFIVEVAIPDDTLEGGFRFDTAEVPASTVEKVR